MALSSITGYPRIGARRELKQAVEGYWEGKVEQGDLEATARGLRLEACERMRDAAIADQAVAQFAGARSAQRTLPTPSGSAASPAPGRGGASRRGGC